MAAVVEGRKTNEHCNYLIRVEQYIILIKKPANL